MSSTSTALPVDRGSQLRSLVWPLVWDLGLAIGVYYGLRVAGAGEYLSLLGGSIVAAGRIIWVAVRNRRIEPFAVFLCLVFCTGLGLSFLTGDPRLVLAKDSATSGVAGLAFVVSCLIRHPLAYYASLRFAGPSAANSVRARWQDPEARRGWYLASVVWGVGLLVEASARIWVVYQLPVDEAVAVSNGLMVLAYTVLIAWTIRSTRRAMEG